MVTDPFLRMLLARYAAGEIPLKEDEVKTMVELSGHHSKELEALLIFLGGSSAPKPYRQLLRNLALDSPVCGMFHPSPKLRETLEKMRKTEIKSSPDILQELQLQIPVVQYINFFL